MNITFATEPTQQRLIDNIQSVAKAIFRSYYVSSHRNNNDTISINAGSKNHDAYKSIELMVIKEDNKAYIKIPLRQLNKLFNEDCRHKLIKSDELIAAVNEEFPFADEIRCRDSHSDSSTLLTLSPATVKFSLNNLGCAVLMSIEKALQYGPLSPKGSATTEINFDTKS